MMPVNRALLRKVALLALCLAWMVGLPGPVHERPVQAAAMPAVVAPGAFIKGVDVSYVTRVEQRGGVYRDACGAPGDVFEIMRESGVNYVRLRLWYAPPEGYCNAADALALAARASQEGFKILLDLHYSDGWADPGNQTKPVAWQGLTYAQLQTAVTTYTYQIVSDLIQQNTPPDMVQIGNEITAGLLWDDGRVAPSEFDTPAQWANLAGLIRAGSDGVSAAGSTAQLMIHIDRGGDNAGARWFLDNLIAQDVAFDVIGLSYYSYWHGPMAQLQATLDDLALKYDKGIILVETAYPWTLGWNDWTHNLIGLPAQLLPGYAASEAGQAAFLRDVIQHVQATPNGKGLGVFYWGGEWISTGITDTQGSSWENQALFDFDGNPVAALSVFSADAATGIYLPLMLVHQAPR
ncbi:MAG: glycosyl hydrolase 53 family protein [Anaerolineae bacterium]|nr:glycosyl hydrolase 53 family protein [Anaerolineae bacterium]